MKVSELEQLEERYNALSQECRQRSSEIGHLKAAPEEKRDNSLIRERLAEYAQKADELQELVKQVIAGREDIATRGLWGQAGAVSRIAMQACISTFIDAFPLRKDGCVAGCRS
jgi:hypothetical protein